MEGVPPQLGIKLRFRIPRWNKLFFQNGGNGIHHLHKHPMGQDINVEPRSRKCIVVQYRSGDFEELGHQSEEAIVSFDIKAGFQEVENVLDRRREDND